MVGAMSLGDAWRPTRDLQIQYGVRVDGNQFLNGPDAKRDSMPDKFGRDNTRGAEPTCTSARVSASRGPTARPISWRSCRAWCARRAP